MRSVVARWAEADKALRAVGWQQRRLAPLVGDDVRAALAAALADLLVAGEGAAPRRRVARLMVAVERDMKEQSEQRQPRHTRVTT